MKALLLVANYDSGAGYAWWLMESFWARLAEHYHGRCRVLLAYPSISSLPITISSAPLEVVQQDFNRTGIFQVLTQCRFLYSNNVTAVYFSDKPTWHWRYVLYRLYGARVIIVHDHTPGARTPAKGLTKLLKKAIHRLPWLAVDGAIGATEYVRQRLIEVNCLPPERCFAAPNGLPFELENLEKSDLHTLFSIPEHRTILIMTGRADHYKGADFMLKALAHLKAAGECSFHFVFVGDGPHLQMFKDNSRDLGLEEHVAFVGKRNDIPALLLGADIAVHPSKGEVGYSLSILEYMRAGLPVVVPDNPSVCGAIEHEVTGLVYPEGDHWGAIHSIQRLLHDSGLAKRLGKQAKDSVRKYTLQNTHAALLNAFLWIDRHNMLVMKGSHVNNPR